MQSAADSTVLMAAKLSAAARAMRRSQSSAATYFRDVLGDGVVASASLTVTKASASVWRASANLDVPTSFGRLIGRDVMPVAAAAEAAVNAPAAEYLDIYVLVDVSQSWGSAPIRPTRTP